MLARIQQMLKSTKMPDGTRTLILRNDRLDNGLTETGKTQDESTDIECEDVFQSDSDVKNVEASADTRVGCTDDVDEKKTEIRNAMINHWVQLCQTNFKEHKVLSQRIQEKGPIGEILKAEKEYWEDQLFIADEKMCEAEVEYEKAFVNSGSWDQTYELPTGYIRAVKLREIQEWFSARQFFISMQILDPKSKVKDMEDDDPVINIKASQSDITITQWEKQMFKFEKEVDRKRRRDEAAIDMTNLASAISLDTASSRANTKDHYESFRLENQTKMVPIEIDFLCKTFKILPAIPESLSRSPTPAAVSRSPTPPLGLSRRGNVLSPFPVLPKIPQITDSRADDTSNVTRFPVVSLPLPPKLNSTKATVGNETLEDSIIRTKSQSNIYDFGSGNVKNSIKFRPTQNIRPALMSIPEEVQDFRCIMKRTSQYPNIDIQNDRTKAIHLDLFQKTKIPVRNPAISLNEFLSMKLKLPPKEKYLNSKLQAPKILVRKPNVYRHPCTVTPRTKQELVKGSNIPVLTTKYILRRRQIMLRKSKIPVPINPKLTKSKSKTLNTSKSKQHFKVCVHVSKTDEFIYKRDSKYSSTRKSSGIQTGNTFQHNQPIPPSRPVYSETEKKPTSTHLRRKFFKVPAPV